MKVIARQVEGRSKGDSTDSEDANRVMEVNQVRDLKQEHTKQAKVDLEPIDHGGGRARSTVQLHSVSV